MHYCQSELTAKLVLRSTLETPAKKINKKSQEDGKQNKKKERQKTLGNTTVAHKTDKTRHILPSVSTPLEVSDVGRLTGSRLGVRIYVCSPGRATELWVRSLSQVLNTVQRQCTARNARDVCLARETCRTTRQCRHSVAGSLCIIRPRENRGSCRTRRS